MRFITENENIQTTAQTEYLQRELVFFYFQIFRKNKDILYSFAERLSNVLNYIKKNPEETTNFLKYFYRLLFFIRAERGEHDITYQLILVWHTHFPELAKKFVEQLFPTEKNNELRSGCWRDAKYLCYQHPLIELCVELMNKQLKKDLETYNTTPISNVAKWIPREHKKFDWLYTELVIHWFSKIQRVKYSCTMSHHKNLYRKKVAFLNKLLDTTQIKQCSRSTELILPNNITKLTLVKQKSLLEEKAVQEYYTNFFSNKGEQLEDTSIQDKMLMSRKKTRTMYNNEIPISHYIKEAYQLIRESNNPENSASLVLFRTQLLNEKWKKMVNYVSKSFQDMTEKRNIIPMMDNSYTMYSHDEECYHTAIGLAFLLCEISGLGKRVLCIDNLPTWLNLSDCDTLMSMVMKYENNTKNTRFSFCNITAAMDMIVLSIQQSQLALEEVANLRIVLLSDFYSWKTETPPLIFENAERESGLYYEIKERFVGQLHGFLPENIPNIVFWNLSKENIVEIPCSIYQDKVQLLSGYSIVEINNMATGKNPYQCMMNTLQNRKFEIADKMVQEYVGGSLIQCV
jgi:hypothetical protein